MPGGTLGGAAQLLLSHRCLQNHGGQHGALRLFTVDIGDIGHHICHAIAAGGGYLGVADIEVGGVSIHDVKGNILHIAFLLRDGNSQVGNGRGHHQHFADGQLADIIAGVQCQQFVGGHAVSLCDFRPGITLLHGIGDFLHLGAVQYLRDVTQIHDLVC